MVLFVNNKVIVVTNILSEISQKQKAGCCISNVNKRNNQHCDLFSMKTGALIS